MIPAWTSMRTARWKSPCKSAMDISFAAGMAGVPGLFRQRSPSTLPGHTCLASRRSCYAVMHVCFVLMLLEKILHLPRICITLAGSSRELPRDETRPFFASALATYAHDYMGPSRVYLETDTGGFNDPHDGKCWWHSDFQKETRKDVPT